MILCGSHAPVPYFNPAVTYTMRKLIVILGDQLNLDSVVFSDIDLSKDCVWMSEVKQESNHVWSHKARILLFLASMRNFARTLKSRGYWLIYHKIEDHDFSSIGTALLHDLRKFQPSSVELVQPGDHRVLQQITQTTRREGITLNVHEDQHFITTQAFFSDWFSRTKQPRMEYFYRRLRRTTGILMVGDKPVGGRWNFDKDNRQSFGKQGPGLLMAPSYPKTSKSFDSLKHYVERQFQDHPGYLEDFIWPTTRTQAVDALQDFIKHRLYSFGQHQDAMWIKQPFLFHSRLSTALNLKLLSPQEVMHAALGAWEHKRAPIASVEGFIRQIMGWREYVRGIYWAKMPDYEFSNALSAELPLPRFYWTGQTEMFCLQEIVLQILQYGYAHHIQRLMVTGLFCLLLGVQPRLVHEWYLAMFVDAVEWVEMPNTIGMSQYGDNGLLASKPYIASGKYIQRMSNYCSQCRYNPGRLDTDTACPFNILYWDFLLRHEKKFSQHPRMGLQIRNLEKFSRLERKRIRRHANKIRHACCDETV